MNGVCTGFEENLAELADSEAFVELMPITAMQHLLTHCMSTAGGGVDSALSIRIALHMAVKFPSSDSSQIVEKAFGAARSAQKLMENLSPPPIILVRLPLSPLPFVIMS